MKFVLVVFFLFSFLFPTLYYPNHVIAADSDHCLVGTLQFYLKGALVSSFDLPNGENGAFAVDRQFDTMKYSIQLTPDEEQINYKIYFDDEGLGGLAGTWYLANQHGLTLNGEIAVSRPSLTSPANHPFDIRSHILVVERNAGSPSGIEGVCGRYGYTIHPTPTPIPLQGCFISLDSPSSPPILDNQFIVINMKGNYRAAVLELDGTKISDLDLTAINPTPITGFPLSTIYTLPGTLPEGNHVITGHVTNITMGGGTSYQCNEIHLKVCSSTRPDPSCKVLPSPTITLVPTIPPQCLPGIYNAAPKCKAGDCNGECAACCEGQNYKPQPSPLPLCDQISSTLGVETKESCKKCVEGRTLADKDGNLRVGIWSAIGCIPTNPVDILNITILGPVELGGLGFGIAGGIAFLYFLYGAFLILTSMGNPERINQGKEIMVSAISGLLLILFSIFILQVIGEDILRIPGFGGNSSTPTPTP